MVQTISRAQYLAGLWQEHIPEQLNWRINPDVRTYSCQALEYRAPTWSWTSIDGPIFPRRAIREGKCLIEVLQSSTTPVHAEETGQVRDSSVSLRASIFELDSLVLRSGSVLDLISFDGGSLRYSLTVQPDVSLQQGELGADISFLSGEFEESLWLMPISQSISQP